MGIIFKAIPPTEIKLPVSQIVALVEASCDNKWTGLIRLAYGLDKHLYLIFKRGEILVSYFLEADLQESISSEIRMEWIKSAGGAYAKVVSLSSFSLFICKLLIQSNGGKVEFLYNQSQVSEYLAAIKDDPELRLLQLNWDNAMGAVLFIDRGIMEPVSFFVSEETVFEETGINEAFFTWGESLCTTTAFKPVLSVEAWQEYYLRQSFADICNFTIKRFEAMTGRALVDSLVRLVAIFASKSNLDIVMVSRRMIDREVFASALDAAENYRRILREMFGHFSVIVGPRLLAVTLQEIVASFPAYERAIIRTFDLLPEGYIYE